MAYSSFGLDLWAEVAQTCRNKGGIWNAANYSCTMTGSTGKQVTVKPSGSQIVYEEPPSVVAPPPPPVIAAPIEQPSWFAENWWMVAAGVVFVGAGGYFYMKSKKR